MGREVQAIKSPWPYHQRCHEPHAPDAPCKRHYSDWTDPQSRDEVVQWTLDSYHQEFGHAAPRGVTVYLGYEMDGILKREPEIPHPELLRRLRAAWSSRSQGAP